MSSIFKPFVPVLHGSDKSLTVRDDHSDDGDDSLVSFFDNLNSFSVSSAPKLLAESLNLENESDGAPFVPQVTTETAVGVLFDEVKPSIIIEANFDLRFMSSLCAQNCVYYNWPTSTSWSFPSSAYLADRNPENRDIGHFYETWVELNNSGNKERYVLLEWQDAFFSLLSLMMNESGVNIATKGARHFHMLGAKPSVAQENRHETPLFGYFSVMSDDPVAGPTYGCLLCGVDSMFIRRLACLGTSNVKILENYLPPVDSSANVPWVEDTENWHDSSQNSQHNVRKSKNNAIIIHGNRTNIMKVADCILEFLFLGSASHCFYGESLPTMPIGSSGNVSLPRLVCSKPFRNSCQSQIKCEFLTPLPSSFRCQLSGDISSHAINDLVEILQAAGMEKAGDKVMDARVAKSDLVDLQTLVQKCRENMAAKPKPMLYTSSVPPLSTSSASSDMGANRVPGAPVARNPFVFVTQKIPSKLERIAASTVSAVAGGKRKRKSDDMTGHPEELVMPSDSMERDSDTSDASSTAYKFSIAFPGMDGKNSGYFVSSVCVSQPLAYFTSCGKMCLPSDSSIDIEKVPVSANALAMEGTNDTSAATSATPLPITADEPSAVNERNTDLVDLRIGPVPGSRIISLSCEGNRRSENMTADAFVDKCSFLVTRTSLPSMSLTPPVNPVPQYD